MAENYEGWVDAWHPSFLIWFKEVIEVINLNCFSNQRWDRKDIGSITFWRDIHAKNTTVADAVIYWMDR